MDDLAAKITALLVVLIIIGLYLFPWLVPLLHEMPENSTMPYYALLLAIETQPYAKAFKEGALYGKKGE